MRHSRAALRSLMVLMLAAFVSACASSGMTDELDPDQSMFRVTNDTSEPHLTVSLDDMNGNVVPLGTVDRNDTNVFVFRIPENTDQYQLIAVGPGDQDRDDYTISDPFTLSGGATVNWFVLENRVEVN